MSALKMNQFPRPQRGATLIEILVTLVIIAFGLLGMVGLQTRLQISEMESYQRTQALLLLNDMANRIATNRTNAASYLIAAGSPVGTGASCGGIGTSTQVQRDRTDWCHALQGRSERISGTSAYVGAMIGGRGCVELGGVGEYMVTIAWQGMTPLAAPPTTVACGAGQYNGGACSNDLCRRAVTTLVRVATL